MTFSIVLSQFYLVINLAKQTNFYCCMVFIAFSKRNLKTKKQKTKKNRLIRVFRSNSSKQRCCMYHIYIYANYWIIYWAWILFVSSLICGALWDMSTQTPLIESIKTSTPSASVSLFHGRKIMRYSINVFFFFFW